jgi:predicted O-methyltransferase YrrM
MRSIARLSQSLGGKLDMGVILDLARAVVPRRAKRYLRERRRRAQFDEAMHRLARSDPLSSGNFPAGLAHQLVVGWANEKMSASEEFLQAIFRYAGESKGPILECGSGLSTLVLGLAAKRNRQRVWSLEDDPFWASVVRAALTRFDIRNVEVCESPLRNYGDFEWYDPPKQRLATEYSLVICDGPQGTTPGGRYGLLPVLGSHLRTGCVILLDDATRAGEQQVLARWQDEMHVSHEVFGSTKPFARLLMPPA